MAGTRSRALIVPREHGAWGILFIPLVTGATLGIVSGGSPARLVPFCIAATALFWLRTPLESWIGSSAVRASTPAEIRLARVAALALAAVAAVALIWLFWVGPNRGLVWIGLAAVAAFLLQAAWKAVQPRARGAAQMIGSVGLTSTAPAAYYAATGYWDRAAVWLWAANLAFALNQIQFVQLRIHAARAATRGEKVRAGWRFLLTQLVLAGLIAEAWAADLLPWYAAISFLPVLFRGFAWFAAKPRPLAIHQLGRRELAYAILFGACLVAGMLLG